MLSRIFTIAVDYSAAELNPCGKAKKFALDNMRYRYPLPKEELRLSRLDFHQRLTYTLRPAYLFLPARQKLRV
jgi:hypothetical protein